MGYLDSVGLAHLWTKIKGALTGKQDKLTGQPGQVVGFGADKSAAAVQGWSNPNLLDNWYFTDLINQRGQMEYAGNGTYSIDRFLIRGPVKVQLGNDGLMISRNNISLGGITQGIEDGITRLAGKTVTLSVLVDGLSAGAFELFFGSSNSIVNAGTTYGLIMVNTSGLATTTVTLPDIFPGSCLAAHFWLLDESHGGTIGACKIRAMKLELGSQQTLAHQDADGNWVLNDPPPNKALELAKCQRYYCRLTTGRFRESSATSGAGMYFCIPIHPMRIKPTIKCVTTNDSTQWIRSSDNNTGIFKLSELTYAVAYYASNLQFVTLAFKKENVTTYQDCHLIINQGYIELDANL